VVYQRCLAIELSKEGLNYDREKEQPIFYHGFEVGSRRADFVVENAVLVELKAISVLENVHLAQARNYLAAYDLQVGLLINFGAKSLEFKKIYNSRYFPASTSAT